MCIARQSVRSLPVDEHWRCIYLGGDIVWCQVWQCGGQLLMSTCSHVGHVFRRFTPHSFPGGLLGGLRIVQRNMERLVNVWLEPTHRAVFYLATGTGLWSSDWWCMLWWAGIDHSAWMKALQWMKVVNWWISRWCGGWSLVLVEVKCFVDCWKQAEVMPDVAVISMMMISVHFAKSVQNAACRDQLLCPAPRVGGFKRWYASDICLSVAYIRPKPRTEA